MSKTEPLTKPNIAIVCSCGIKVDEWIVDFESSGVIHISDINLHFGIGHRLFIKTMENSSNYEKGIEVYCLACGRHQHIDKKTFELQKEFHCLNCGNKSWSGDID